MSELTQTAMDADAARRLTERIRIAARDFSAAANARSALRQTERTSSMEGVVYFIQAEHGGPIKVGVASNPAERLRQLQTGSPHPLKILATAPGGYALERELHSRFSYFQLRGEWFEPIPELFDYMRIAQNV